LVDELNKWISGAKSEATTLDARLRLARPVAFEIKNVLPGKAAVLASLQEAETPSKEFEAYPTYRANVGLEFESQAGTPLTKIATFTLTWSTKRKVWYIREEDR
jgi:hypothetical protein